MSEQKVTAGCDTLGSFAPKFAEVCTYLAFYVGRPKAWAVFRMATEGRLFELQPLEPYPRAYDSCVKQAKKEIDAGLIPELKALPDTPGDYDTVFFGSPICTAAAGRTPCRK